MAWRKVKPRGCECIGITLPRTETVVTLFADQRIDDQAGGEMRRLHGVDRPVGCMQAVAAGERAAERLIRRGERGSVVQRLVRFLGRRIEALETSRFAAVSGENCMPTNAQWIQPGKKNWRAVLHPLYLLIER